MSQAGLSDDLIVARLRRENKAFDLTTEEMIRLKKARIGDAVVKVMLDPAANVAVTVGPAPATASGAVPNATGSSGGDPNDPMTPHDSGIYLLIKDREGNPQMVVLERAAYQGSKTGGVLTSAMTYGIKKMNMKAVIPGAHASIRTTDSSQVFYFYFEDKAAGLGRNYFGTANVTNPNQFALVKLDTAKSNRETVIGQFGAFGSSTGTSEKAMTGFKSERIRAGLYKVTPNDPLQPGEYCFLASTGSMGAFGAGAAGAADIFDFAVLSPQ